MYTDEDLKSAVNAGIFRQKNVDEFRTFIAKSHNSPSVDEENFRLISGFNDIFVVIASILMLLSASWVTYEINPTLSAFVVAILSWGLAEFFVRKRKMSFPAIVLLITFVGSIFFGTSTLFSEMSDIEPMISSAVAVIAAFIHWKRFFVPITVAAGVFAFIIFLVSIFLSIIENFSDYLEYIIFTMGVITFFIAMYWDSSDTKRVTKNSDVAFWLHLLSAPLIVHPFFTIFGVFDNETDILSIFFIVILYVVLSSISLIIDRRAFMVSSLLYVLYALNTLFEVYGIVNNSFAMAGIFIGLTLLLLSGYWSKARKFLLGFMPEAIRFKVPNAV